MTKVVTFGEVMMRLSPPLNYKLIQTNHLDIIYGGGEANVSASLAQMGVPAEHVTCFPANDLGKAAAQFFQQYGVSMANTVFRGNRLGLYFLEAGASVRASKIVYDRADSAFANLDPAGFDWEKILTGADWFHWTGITPAISDTAARACADAIATARRLGVKVSADVNYRRNLWQYGKKAQDVMPALVEGCDVVVCAENDADDLFAITPDPAADHSFVSMSEQLMARFPAIKQVITTRRDTLSASHNQLRGLLYDGESFVETPTYDIVPIVDRIGGGDAFMAGFIYGSLTYPSASEALLCGVAASVIKHSIHGDFNLASVAEVEEVMRGNTSGRLLR
ncbi:sugar kinase [Arsenicibacter rosenii]|uniref:2-dehydro-3-deoxygluconokinase n=1 Tax=Arsenicibacter rosenii TaxID=1750698 RepID=A0A1S2VFM5_9BACT|nr:sugar kinase [Arsenicibacter rosenii]OIN57557.1 2-dehydro-3-deoxygluconokinase [Arsenicibacter rosenii]